MSSSTTPPPATPPTPAPQPTLKLTTTLAAEFGHNTSAHPAYNKNNFPNNFKGITWVDQSGTTAPVDSSKTDDSLNPVTPCHVSNVSVETLLPGPWYAHMCNWFQLGGGSGHLDFGINCDSDAYVSESLAAMQAWGFKGCTLDWYGPNHGIEDKVALRIKAHVATLKDFTYVIQIDQGGYNTTAELEALVAYAKATYWSSPGYMTVNGVPVLMFFSTKPGVDYAAVHAKYASSYWIMEGAGQLGSSYADGVSDWSHSWHHGVSATDPHNIAAINSFLSATHGTKKGVMLCISPRFNGYLTRAVTWSRGKMMPGDNGKCWLDQAKALAANLPTNCLGVQVVWNDHEEGAGIEFGIDNGVNVTVPAVIVGGALVWTVSGDEKTIDHYEVLASPDGIKAAVYPVPATGAGKYTFDVGAFPTCSLYVVAVGKPCIRNQFSGGVAYLLGPSRPPLPIPNPTPTPNPPPPPPPSPTTVTLTISGTISGPSGGPYTGTIVLK